MIYEYTHLKYMYKNCYGNVHLKYMIYEYAHLKYML